MQATDANKLNFWKLTLQRALKTDHILVKAEADRVRVAIKGVSYQTRAQLRCGDDRANMLPFLVCPREGADYLSWGLQDMGIVPDILESEFRKLINAYWWKPATAGDTTVWFDGSQKALEAA